jgi:class 3 adenylate cyclase
MNKEQKSRLLMSESTRELLADEVEVKCLGSVAIRGKTLPMKIYTAATLIDTTQEKMSAVVGSEDR